MMKKASELLEESADQFDKACVIVREIEDAIKEVMKHMRNPEKGVIWNGIYDTEKCRMALDKLFKMVSDE